MVVDDGGDGDCNLVVRRAPRVCVLTLTSFLSSIGIAKPPWCRSGHENCGVDGCRLATRPETFRRQFQPWSGAWSYQRLATWDLCLHERVRKSRSSRMCLLVVCCCYGGGGGGGFFPLEAGSVFICLGPTCNL